MPQVSFLSGQTFCRDKHGFMTTEHVFCRDKSMLVVTKVLSRKNYVCRDKTFVATHICRDKQNFVATKFYACLSRQNTFFCRDKTMLVETKHVFVATNICRDKHTFVAKKTNVLCRDKHMFVATNLLSRRKLYLWPLPLTILLPLLQLL